MIANTSAVKLNMDSPTGPKIRKKRVAEASLPAEYFLHQEKGVGARVRLAADSTYLVNVSVVIRERVSLESG